VESTLRFGSDRANVRSEDEPLVTGHGRFTDDVNVDGQAHAVFLRATVGHAELHGVDSAAAHAMPGVLGIFTGEDLADAGIGAIPPALLFNGRDGKPMFGAPMPLMAQGRIRFVGEILAVVVAKTRAQAEDAAEQINVNLTELPAASHVEKATAPGATPVWPERPGNVALDWQDGDPAIVDAAFARAAHVARAKLEDTRLAPAAMEPRAAIASYDASTDRLTLIASTQGVAIVRRMFAEFVFKIPPQKLRVLTHDVGGGFGMKVQAYAEYGAILFAARRLGCPVKWRGTRLESFLADTAGRDGVLEGEMAFDAQGKILALRIRNLVGMGAYITTFGAVFATNNTKNCLSSVYRIPAIQTNVKMVLTNAAPLGPYRGAGRPEAIYMIERLIDSAARAMGVDRAELRRRNLIAATAMPYQAPNGMIYDSGEFEAILDKALALADWRGFAARRTAAEQRGKLRGIGMCCFLEVAGGILDETADLRFERDGKVALRLGVQAIGQGHLSTFPPLVAKKLGVDASAVRLIQGDSDEVPAGTPSVASRSIMMAGSATVVACDEAIAKGKQIAGHVLEAAVADIEFSAGTFRVSGTDRAMPILELAERARAAKDLPEELAKGLDSVAKFVSPQMSFPNGCHICELEIDSDTGVVEVVRYSAVDDVGNVLHETIVDGQIHGGVAQGLGQVLGEWVQYDANGQLLTASFMDYVMPHADDMPPLAVSHHNVPCATNPLGAKGAGESGVAGALPSAMNAVLDALSVRGITRFDLPASAPRVWAALQAARS
jgi:carbon-monoxide dehydrogenase large subunit